MHIKFEKKRIFFVLILFFISGVGKTQVRDQIFSGTRPQSLGEAFLAVADDGNAIFWNPAGLARMERIQASFAYADRFGIGLNSYYANFLSRLYFIPPLTDYLTFGVDWSAIKLTNDDELDFSSNELHFALGIKPPINLRYLNNLSLGVSATYLSMFARAYGILDTEVNASGWGWNLGLLYHVERLKILPGQLNAGLMIHDIGGTTITHDTRTKEKVLHQNIRWGLSYRPFEEFPGRRLPISDPVLAMDIDDRIHLGLECWLAHTLAIRAGVQKDLHTHEKMTFAFGLGIKLNLKDWPGASIDYALTDSPVLPNSNQQFGGSLIFKENPRLIRIEGAHIYDVYASLYRHYGLPGSQIGTIKLRNIHQDSLKVWIAFEKNPYMEAQLPDTMTIAPGLTVDFPLRAVFKSNIFKTPDERLTGRIKVYYQHNDNEYSSPAAIDFSLFGKNYLTWDDPGKAAAFVLTGHPVVREFVHQATSQRATIDQSRWFCRYNIADAILIFNGLATLGIKYHRDLITRLPSSDEMSRGGQFRLDQIIYPTDYLVRNIIEGDCDDFSVLYATLLQQAGLPVAFISGPGHIFVMFDTFIPQSDTIRLAISPALFVRWKESLWIPVETTLIPTHTFAAAWSAGADSMKNDPYQNKWEIFDVAQYQAIYPSVSVDLIQPPKLDRPVPDLTSSMLNETLAIDELKERYHATFEARLKDESLTLNDKVKLRNHYGIILGQNGEADRARIQFQSILADTNYSASVWNNLGNINFILGDYENAESAYKKSLQIDEFSRGTYLNLAILYQMMIDSTSAASPYQAKSEKMLLKAAQLLEGNIETAFTLFGFEEKTQFDVKAQGIIGNLKNRLKKVRNFIDNSFRKYLQRHEIKGVALDKYGTKGHGEIDPDWGMLLFWNYE